MCGAYKWSEIRGNPYQKEVLNHRDHCVYCALLYKSNPWR